MRLACPALEELLVKVSGTRLIGIRVRGASKDPARGQGFKSAIAWGQSDPDEQFLPAPQSDRHLRQGEIVCGPSSLGLSLVKLSGRSSHFSRVINGERFLSLSAYVEAEPTARVVYNATFRINIQRAPKAATWSGLACAGTASDLPDVSRLARCCEAATGAIPARSILARGLGFLVDWRLRAEDGHP